MRAEILVGLERRRRWSADDKLSIVREAFADGRKELLAIEDGYRESSKRPICPALPAAASVC